MLPNTDNSRDPASSTTTRIGQRGSPSGPGTTPSTDMPLDTHSQSPSLDLPPLSQPPTADTPGFHLGLLFHLYLLPSRSLLVLCPVTAKSISPVWTPPWIPGFYNWLNISSWMVNRYLELNMPKPELLIHTLIPMFPVLVMTSPARPKTLRFIIDSSLSNSQSNLWANPVHSTFKIQPELNHFLSPLPFPT